MNINDFEDLDLIEMEAEILFSEVAENNEIDLSKSPHWWNVSLGLIEATREQEKEAKKVFDAFLQSNFTGCIFDRFKQFEENYIN